MTHQFTAALLPNYFICTNMVGTSSSASLLQDALQTRLPSISTPSTHLGSMSSFSSSLSPDSTFRNLIGGRCDCNQCPVGMSVLGLQFLVTFSLYCLLRRAFYHPNYTHITTRFYGKLLSNPMQTPYTSSLFVRLPSACLAFLRPCQPQKAIFREWVCLIMWRLVATHYFQTYAPAVKVNDHNS